MMKISLIAVSAGCAILGLGVLDILHHRPAVIAAAWILFVVGWLALTRAATQRD